MHLSLVSMPCSVALVWVANLFVLVTVPEASIAPENGLLENLFPFWDGFLAGAMLVAGIVYVVFFRV